MLGRRAAAGPGAASRPVHPAASPAAARRAWLVQACSGIATLWRATALPAGLAGCGALPYRYAPFGTFAPLAYEVRLPGDASLCLFGTLHVGLARFYPLPLAIDARFANADGLAIEIDTTARWHALVAGFQPHVRLPDGTSLDDLLSPDRVRQIRAYFAFDDAAWAWVRTMQPWWVANFRFGTPADRAIDARSAFGGERHLLARARAAGLPVIELEGPEDQIVGFAGGDLDEQVAQLLSWFDAVRSQGGLLAALVAAWRTGDADRLEAIKSQAWGDATRLVGLRRRFFGDRDRRMAERLARACAPGRRLFAAIGAFHLVGDDSVPQCLRRLGAAVARIDTRDPPPMPVLAGVPVATPGHPAGPQSLARLAATMPVFPDPSWTRT
jgi:uncharacterized protein YbaP (TraB family)